MRYCTLDQLTASQIEQYHRAIPLAFPPIIARSPHIARYWPFVEKYFPKTQSYLIDDLENVVAFINAIPFHFDKDLKELPDKGWDWMLQKGIEDHEKNIQANTLGGLQVIVLKEHQKKGYSQLMIEKAKKITKQFNLSRTIIPIRPILKHLHPHAKMDDYMKMKKGEDIYDPWIRTHVKSGAKIIKVCSQAMTVEGDLEFWQDINGKPFNRTGSYLIDRALNPIDINIDSNYGIYQEENIWIAYD